ncbi:MAG: hypothetical protein CV081_11715, partial [Nitrospira sp. LK265]|nr:hypothetical protein [Nitrospira sp. LK265]
VGFRSRSFIESPTIVLRLWPLLMADDGQGIGDRGNALPPLHIFLQPPYNTFFDCNSLAFQSFGQPEKSR